MIGPWPQAEDGREQASLSVPAGWAGGETYVLTAAADFLGDRVLLRRALQDLLPWAPKPLPAAAAPDGPETAGDRDGLLAGLAVRAASAGAAHVLVVLSAAPWADPLARAVIGRAGAGPGGEQAGPALSVLDLRQAAGGPPVCASDVPLDKLAAIIHRLLGPEGCPWDREQTHGTLCPYLVEEAAEALEAVERRQAHTLCDELGDLLLQIAFHAALGEGAGDFTLSDVVGAITEKMIRRHPHVFADWTVGGPADVLRNWAALKQAEAEDAGRPASDGVWRVLRKQAVRVSLAAFEAAFAASSRNPERWEKAAADLLSGTAVLTRGGSRTLGGGAPPREEDI